MVTTLSRSKNSSSNNNNNTASASWLLMTSLLSSSRGGLRLIALGIIAISAAQIMLLTRAGTEASSSVSDTSSTGNHYAPVAVAVAKTAEERALVRQEEEEDHNNSQGATTNNNNRTLVVLMGNLRGGEKAWSTLYEHVLDVNHADLALLIGDTRAEYRNASLFDRAKYVWRFAEHDDWADAVDEMYGNATWRDRLLPLAHENGELLGGIQGGHDYRGSGLLICMFRWYLTRHITELNLLQRYDRFVVTRADHYYKCQHDMNSLDMQYIWVPKGQDYHGITDRHLVASSRDILPALNLLPPVLENPEKYRDLLQAKTANPEQLIARRWQEDGLRPSRLRRFDRVMFTCGQAGDATRFKTLSITVQPEDVQLKYEREYVTSYKSCGLPMPKRRSKYILSNMSGLCGGGGGGGGGDVKCSSGGGGTTAE